jgi:hypothetical protein
MTRPLPLLRTRLRAGLDQRWTDIRDILPDLPGIQFDDTVRSYAEATEYIKDYIVEEFLKKLYRYEPNITLQGARKTKLERLVKRLSSAIQAIDAMDEELKAELNLDAARVLLAQRRDAARELIPDEVDPTGAAYQSRFDRAKKDRAVEFANELFVLCNVVPTVADGRFIKLSNILYYIATGRVGSARHAALKFLDRHYRP